MKLSGEKALRFIEDIKAGISDEILQQRYNLTGSKFYVAKATAKDYLARQKQEAPATRKISGKKFLEDLQFGMDDEAIMKKYNINARQLQSLLRELINAGLVTPLQLSNRLKITKSQVTEAFLEMGKAVRELD